MADTIEYTGNALRAFYPDRTERRTARVWANEALLHDMAAAFGFEFFEGAGTNPTGLSGYATSKLWLRVDAGVTTAPGEIRKYDGSGDATLLASWPVMNKAAFAAYISGSTTIPVVSTREALKATDYNSTRIVMLRRGAETGMFLFWFGDYSSIVALDTIGGYAMASDLVPTTTGAWLRIIEGDLMNALWFVVDKSGATATHGAVQVAINVAAEAGYKCYFPRGLYRLGATLTHPEASHIVGDGKAAGIFSTKYTYFWADHAGDCFVNDNNNGSRSMRGVNFYRTQPTPGPGWTPNSYGWEYAITGGQDIYFDDIHFHNVNKCIRTVGNVSTGAVCGRIHMKRITGQPLVQAFDFTHCLDVLWGDEIEFWTFYSGSSHVMAYTRTNAVGMILGRVDNSKFGRVFFYGYFRGLMLNYQGALGGLPTGTVSLTSFDVFGSDNTGIAVLTNAGTDGARLHFNHLYGACNLADPAVTTEPFVWTLGNNARISISDLHGQYTTNSLLALNGTGNNVCVTFSTSVGIAYGGSGAPEFNVAAGNTLTLLSSPNVSAATRYGTVAASGIIETPDWREYTTTVTAFSGTFTTVSATAKMRRLPGKNVKIQAHITTTDKGTAATYTNITIPYANGSQWHVGMATEMVLTGISGQIRVAPSASVAFITSYANTFLTDSASQVVVDLEYEAA